MKPLALLGLITGLFLLVAACGGDGDTPSNGAPSGAALSGATPAGGASTGQQLFTLNGCGACHGSGAEGTAIAPGLAGHTVNQVKRQARAPLGLMPVFPPSKVSNSELALIAEYIESLQGDHTHVRVVDPGASAAQHHWMTLFALEDGSANEAVHHIDHIIGLVSGEHLSQMQKAKEQVEEDRLHDAIHTIENMLSGIQVDDLTPSEMHTSLARSSVLINDIEGSLHHLGHVMEELGVDPAFADRVAEIRELLASGDLSEAAHELEELTGKAHEEEHQVENDEEQGEEDGKEHEEEHKDSGQGN